MRTTDDEFEEAAATRENHQINVLLVDDQPIIGEAVRRMLAEEPDVSFRFCADPTEAVAAANEIRPTVILADLVMPQLDGLELVRRFRKNESTRVTPLIVLSSKEEATTKAEAFQLGANDYLVKLPDPIELVARIRHHSAGYIHRLQRDEAYRALTASQKVLRDDLEQAARYVQSLLPPPRDDRVRADWRFIPSASLGGDAFGYHWHDEDHFSMYLLDVSGHGVGAALLSVSALNVLRSETLPRTDFKDPGQVLTSLSDKFQTPRQSGKYFTIWYGVYQPSTRILAYAGGGHPPAVLIETGDGEPERLASTGPMPGILPGLSYETSTQALAPDSRLFLFSDGIYEIPDAQGVVWTLDAFVDVLAKLGPDAGCLDRIVQASRSRGRGAPFDDDVSLVKFEFP